MGIISYAQNFEDVMLFRAFKDIENGFYIDVGASDPETLSVTKLFYDRGWQGINVEPLASSAERLRSIRKRDINLEVAAGRFDGEIHFYDVNDSGLSTNDKRLAEQHQNTFGVDVVERVVPSLTLKTICEEYCKGEIHFLKIDVEGAELEVVQGMDFTKFRPWVLLIEATRPTSKEDGDREWEPLVLGSQYEYVYFDGVNRFYLANEHKNIRYIFDTPPNIWDEITTAREHIAEGARHAAEAAQKEIEWANKSLQESYDLLLAENEKAVNELKSIYLSRTWRLSSTLRNLWKLLKGRSRDDVPGKGPIIRPIQTLIQKEKENDISLTVSEPIEILCQNTPIRMNDSERIRMTSSCSDADGIPKVPNAGKVVKLYENFVQIMHNGLLVVSGGYYGDWMTTLITNLRGHHEPQEEKVFYQVLERMRATEAQRSFRMIELGSFWAYYSMWFKKVFPNASVYAFEPDPNNLRIGQKNAEMNGLEINFMQAAAGNKRGEMIQFKLDSDSSKVVQVPVWSVDFIAEKHHFSDLDILHMDVQGKELDALVGAEGLILSGRLRFLFVSTHHYSISHDFTTHQACVDFIKERRGHIIASHSVLESFSGDGLIVASFSKEDREFAVSTSLNSSYESLFRPYEEDMAILSEHFSRYLPR